MNDLEQQLRRALEAEASSLRVRSVRLRAPAPSHWPLVIATAGLIVVALVAALPIVVGTPATPAAQTTPRPATAAERLGPDATVCDVAAASGLLAASFAEGTDTSARCQLLVSKDDGRTWERELEKESVLAIAIDPVTRSVFAGTATGSIWLRAGGSWQRVYTAPAGTFQPLISKLAIERGVVYAAGRGLLVSVDGRSWRDVTSGLGTIGDDVTRRGRFAISEIAVIERSVVVLVGDAVPEAGLWAYDTSVGQWRRAASFPAGGLRALVAYGAMLVVATTERMVWSSNDGGTSWLGASTGLSGREPMSLVANAGRLIVGTDRGAFSYDGSQWRPLGTPPPLFVRALALRDDDVFLGSAGGLWRVRLDRP